MACCDLGLGPPFHRHGLIAATATRMKRPKGTVIGQSNAEAVVLGPMWDGLAKSSASQNSATSSLRDMKAILFHKNTLPMGDGAHRPRIPRPRPATMDSISHKMLSIPAIRSSRRGGVLRDQNDAEFASLSIL